MSQQKQTVFSGMQPSGGSLTLGNYLGALNNWIQFSEKYLCYYCIVDMHAITIRQDSALLKQQTMNAYIQYIAAGLDVAKNVIYVQSQVPQHAELSWILSCFTYMGELSRMTQFKDKSQNQNENINAGLYTYPVLMAADIFMHNAHLVPVGEDQRQHLELARDLAVRLNSVYGENFINVPEPAIMEKGAKIMSLQTPSKKMSKSEENVNGVIFLTDDEKVILNKFKRAVTDSGSEVIARSDKPGVTNLIEIYSVVTKKSIGEIEKEFDGVGYGKFKQAVGEVVVDMLAPIQQKIKDLSKNKDYIEGLIKENTEKARYSAEKNLMRIHKKIGFIKRT